MAEWVCNECGSAFDEPQRVDECVGEYCGSKAWDTFYYCPACGSEDFSEAVECAICGEDKSADDIDGYGFCPDCRMGIRALVISILPANNTRRHLMNYIEAIIEEADGLYTEVALNGKI